MKKILNNGSIALLSALERQFSMIHSGDPARPGPQCGGVINKQLVGRGAKSGEM